VWRGGTATAAAAVVEASAAVAPAAAAAAAATTISTRCSSYEASAGNLVEADHGCDASWRGGALVGACRRRWRRRRQQRRRRRVLRGRGECTAAAVCASGVRARRPWKPAKTRGREQPPPSPSTVTATAATSSTRTTTTTTTATTTTTIPRGASRAAAKIP